MPTRPKIINTKLVAQSRLFNVEQVNLAFSNGVNAQYERLMGSKRGAVLIIPMLDENTVLLIREYAVGVERYEIALPKGKLETDESLLDAANRELMEETGYGAKQLKHITSFTIAPGYLSHTTHIILAQDLYDQRLKGDEPEPIEVIPWQLNQIYALTQNEECTEARSIAALYFARDYLNKFD